jgi:hypothetical protein
LGADVAFTLRRTNDAGQPVNFDTGSQVYILIDLDRSNPTKIQAGISGALAAIRVDYTVADTVRNTTKFQVILSKDGGETALLVGRFERNDG